MEGQYCRATLFGLPIVSTEAGQTIHYIARWVNKQGEPGPISETLSATIPA